jgi:hypothetical protein
MNPASKPGARRLAHKRRNGGIMSILRITLAALLLAALSFPAISNQTDPIEATSPDDSAEVKTKPKRKPIPKDIVFESPTGDVLFPHRLHMKNKCSTCHHQIRAKDLHSPHEEYLQSTWIDCHQCHKTDPDTDNVYYTCNNCHHAHPQSTRDETHSPKVVVHKSCWKCHEAGTGPEASARCSYCHGNVDKVKDAKAP